jgi:hypothetical protein
MYRQAADPDNVVIQKRYFANADIRVPVTARPFPFLLQGSRHTHRNGMFLVGHHRRAYQLILSGLHRIESVSSRCGMCKGRTLVGCRQFFQ